MDFKLDKGGQLKRFNSDSFLLIDVTTANANTPNSFNRSVPLTNRHNIVARRLSASSLHLSPTTLLKTPSRLDQIKFEECLVETDREAAYEKEVQHAIGISNVWEEFNLDDNEMMETNTPNRGSKVKAKIEPLFICTNLLPGLNRGTTSPARILRKQCFSPSLQQTVKDCSLTPTSPNKFVTSQSHSPIMLRPSPLSFNKRKIADDGDVEFADEPEIKRKFSSVSAGILSSFSLHRTGEPIMIDDLSDCQIKTNQLESSSPPINNIMSKCPLTSAIADDLPLFNNNVMSDSFNRPTKSKINSSLVDKKSSLSSKLENNFAGDIIANSCFNVSTNYAVEISPLVIDCEINLVKEQVGITDETNFNSCTDDDEKYPSQKLKNRLAKEFIEISDKTNFNNCNMNTDEIYDNHRLV